MATEKNTTSSSAVLALETFAAEVDGETYTIRTGDKIWASHPVALAHPKRFREAGATD